MFAALNIDKPFSKGVATWLLCQSGGMWKTIAAVTDGSGISGMRSLNTTFRRESGGMQGLEKTSGFLKRKGKRTTV